MVSVQKLAVGHLSALSGIRGGIWDLGRLIEISCLDCKNQRSTAGLLIYDSHSGRTYGESRVPASEHRTIAVVDTRGLGGAVPLRQGSVQLGAYAWVKGMKLDRCTKPGGDGGGRKSLGSWVDPRLRTCHTHTLIIACHGKLQIPHTYWAVRKSRCSFQHPRRGARNSLYMLRTLVSGEKSRKGGHDCRGGQQQSTSLCWPAAFHRGVGCRTLERE